MGLTIFQVLKSPDREMSKFPDRNNIEYTMCTNLMMGADIAMAVQENDHGF